jgi:TRAP transporter TAXI family solute receptor
VRRRTFTTDCWPIRMSRRWLGCLVPMLPLMTAACGNPAAKPVQEITFVTASSAAFSRQLVEHYNRTLPFAHVSAKFLRGGASAVVADLRAGAGQIGIAQQADAVYIAYRHGVEGDPTPYVNLRGVAVLWRNVLTVVVQSDGHYRSFTDLRGKRVGIFPAGTATEFLSRALLRAYGMTYSDVQPVFDTNSAAMLENLELDAAIFVTPKLPDPIAAGLKETKRLRVLPIPRPIINELLRAQPFLHPALMSSSDWPSQPGDPDQPGDLETVGIDALLVCRDDLAEEAVYEFTKEFFAALPMLAKSNPEAANVDVEKAAATPIPLHPGAARYYREREVLK